MGAAIGKFLIDFTQTTAAAAFGFLIVQFLTAWIGAKKGHAGYVEQERTSDVDRISERIEKLIALGETYWSRDFCDEDVALSHIITSTMHDLGAIATDLFEGMEPSLKAVKTDLARFEDSLSGGRFGGLTKKADLDTLHKARMDGNDLMRTVRRQRKKMKPVWI